jgi:hypothetical protein
MDSAKGDARQIGTRGDVAAAQVASNTHPRAPFKPGEPEEPALPGDGEPVPPGEHKREPIDDPDPADTQLQLQLVAR